LPTRSAPRPPEWDPADARTLSPAEVEAFLRAYAAAAGPAGEAAIARLPGLLDVVVFRALAWCLGFAAEAHRDGAPLPAALAATLARFGAPAFVERCLGARAALRLG